MKRKLIAFTICTALLLTGCGEKKAGEVEDYGVSSSAQSAKSEEGSGTAATEEAGTSVKAPETAGKKTDALPERQNGGTPIWEDTFTIGNVPAEISIDHVSREMDQLHSYKLRDIVEDQVREEEIVKNMFGDTGKELKRNISGESGDNIYLVGFVQGLYGAIHPETDIPNDGKTAVPSWEDGEDMYYHSYEGTYLGLPYYLNISYNKINRDKVVAFYPKNPGDLVDVPELDSFQPIPNHIEGINTEIWSGTNVWEAMKDRPNRTEMSQEQLIAATKDFVGEKLMVRISEEDMKIIEGKEDGNPVQYEIFFYNEDEAEKGKLDKAVLDGYVVHLDMVHAGENMRYWMSGNTADLWVNDKGAVAGYIRCAFEFEEQIADRVQILEFDNLMGAVREILKSEFDPTKINGQRMKINSATLMYYPVESEDDPHEYTLVPAWTFTAESNGTIAYITVNAVDGSRLMILYTQ